MAGERSVAPTPRQHRMKVLLHYAAGPKLESVLAASGDDDLGVAWAPEGDPDRLLVELVDTEALLHVLEPVTAAVMDAAPRLRLVQKLGVGVNTIDLHAARERGIAVANMPGVNSVAVAEHTLALLFAVLRRIPRFDAEVRDGRGWPTDPSFPEHLGEIHGRTVGLVGYGDVARRVDAALTALGATVLHHRRDRSAPGWTALDDMLATSDIVSIHLPLDDSTSGLLDRRRIELLRAGAVLLNTGRGGIVDECALADALRSGHLLGAGLDVFAHEPLREDSPLLHMPNVVLTPHVAWLTAETLMRSIERGIANCRRLQRGEPLENRIV